MFCKISRRLPDLCPGVIGSRLDLFSKAKTNPEKQRQQRQYGDRHPTVQCHRDRQVHHEEHDGSEDGISNVGSVLGDLLYILVDAAELFTEHRPFVPVGGEGRHVDEQLAAKILAEPLRNSKACEPGKTTESSSTDKTKGNEDDQNGRLSEVLLR